MTQSLIYSGAALLILVSIVTPSRGYAIPTMLGAAMLLFLAGAIHGA